MNYFNDLKIKTKIYSLAGSLFFLLLVIMGLGKWRTDANEQIILADKIDHYMLEARRSEKDFFARKELKYAGKVESGYKNILLIASGFKGDNYYDKITENVKIYYDNFRESVQKEKELGLDENSGLQGKLRKSVHALEAIAKSANRDNIMVLLLMARRHEKDFISRGEIKYSEELHKTCEKMMEIINTSNFPVNTKTKMNTLAMSYLRSFDKYAKKKSERDAAIVKLRTAVHKVEPLIAQLTTIARNNSSFWRSTAIVFTIISILLGIILSYFITKMITNPIQRLTENAEAFNCGDMNIRIKSNSNDEIGVLSKVMDKMIEQIGLQIGYLDNLPTPVIIIDKEFNVQYINKIGCELTGNSKEECRASKCYELMHADHCNTDECRLRKVMDEKRIYGAEQVARPNGKELDIMYTGTPIFNKDGELLGALEFVADISNIKEVEKYLDRSTAAIMSAMEKLAEGDLTARVESEKSGDTIAKLFAAFNKTVEKIKQIILEVTEAVESTASASKQISSNAEEMAAGAQEQSAQTSEVSAATQQMAANIIESTQSSALAVELAKRAGDSAKTGGEVVERTIEGIENIAHVVSKAANIVEELGVNSDKIGEITQVIDDIADQTNLLALNAAIEAARAGEQGRGFAVVADEVRKLAERTTNATKEIAEMIRQIQSRTVVAVESIRTGREETEKGKKLALKAGESLEDIVNGSDQVIKAVEQVAGASEEQSATVEQVSKNVEGINVVAQESAMGVGQIAKASEDLNRLTENLQQLVNLFKMDNDGDYRYLVNGNGNILPKKHNMLN